MPYLDIILLLPLLWGMFRGFRRGFIIEVCTLMALILGIYGAATFGDLGADYLVQEFNTEAHLSMVLSFALLFIGIVILVFLFGKMLESVIKLVALGLVNKIFGLVFGLAKFTLIMSGLLFIWNGFPLTKDVIPREWKNNSYLFEPLSDIAPAIYPVLKEQDWTDKLEEGLENIRDKVNI